VLNPIPPTHGFYGMSQVFTFAFNFSDGSGGEKVVDLTIRNNPPVIVGQIGPILVAQNHTIEVNLTPFGHDVEDSASDLIWSISGINSILFDASVNDKNQLTVLGKKPGSDSALLTLRDLDYDADTQQVFISIGKTNHGPKIVSIPVTILEENNPLKFNVVYYYDVDAVDPDNDNLTYWLSQAPDGMTIDAKTGLIKWVPTKEQLGDNQVIIMVSDGLLSDSQAFTIAVTTVKADIYPLRKIHINTIRMDSQEYAYVKAGDIMLVDINFEDKGQYDINKASIRITAESLGISKKIGPFDGPGVDEAMHKGILLEIPQDAKPGVYTLRLAIDTDEGMHRIKHRDFRVVG
jgi:hypothetical protein